MFDDYDAFVGAQPIGKRSVVRAGRASRPLKATEAVRAPSSHSSSREGKAGSASDVSKPFAPVPSPRHIWTPDDIVASDGFGGNAERGPAKWNVNPKIALPAPNQFSDGQTRLDTQFCDAVADADQATLPLAPMESVLDRLPLSASDGGTTEATNAMKPSWTSPRSSKLARREAGDAGLAVDIVKPSGPLPDPHHIPQSGGDVGTSAAEHAKPIHGVPKSNKRQTLRGSGVGDAVQRGNETQFGVDSIAPHSNCVGHHDCETQPMSADASRIGHATGETHRGPADPAPHSNCDGHHILDTHVPRAIACGVDQTVTETQSVTVDPDLIAEITIQWKMRQLWMRSEVALTLQAKSFCRALAHEGDKDEAEAIFKAATGAGPQAGIDIATIAMATTAMGPLLEARKGIEGNRAKIEKLLEKLAKQLDAAAFVKETYGASLVGLAGIVGEAGDLSKYSNPGKLWKRMGLAPHIGKAFSTWRADGGLSKDDWIAAGYNPKRRSVMYVIGNSLIGPKTMGNGRRPFVGQDISPLDWSPLEKLFVERLRHEAARDPENMARPVTKDGKESYSKWAAARAQRYVEKRFLRMLWQAWRGERAKNAVNPIFALPAPLNLAET